VMGTMTLSHCTIYDGRFYATLTGGSNIGVATWTANTAICVSGGRVVLDDVHIIGAPSQAVSPDGHPAYPQGAVNVALVWPGASSHPLWKPTIGAGCYPTNCTITGWPLGEINKGTSAKPNLVKTNFTGSNPISGAGFTLKIGTVSYDPMVRINQVTSGVLAPYQAADALQRDLRALEAQVKQ